MWGGILALALASAGRASADPSKQEPLPLYVPLRSTEELGDKTWGPLRVRVLSQQELSVAEQYFDDGEAVQSVGLPATLGGGYLFYQRITRVGGLSTRLYLARDFAAELEPWGVLPFPVERVVPGFDRVYFLSPGRAVAHSPLEPTLRGLGPLPEVPSYLGLEVVSEKVAVLPAGPLGRYVTHDAGKTFQLEPSRTEPQPILQVESTSRIGPFAEVLSLAIDAGICESSEAEPSCATLYVVTEQKLWKLTRRASKLHLSASVRHDELGSCWSLPDARGLGVCVNERSGPWTHLVRAHSGQLEVVARLPGLHRVLATGGGKVLFDGGCGEAVHPDSGVSRGGAVARGSAVSPGTAVSRDSAVRRGSAVATEPLCLAGGKELRSVDGPRVQRWLAYGTNGSAVFALSRGKGAEGPEFELHELGQPSSRHLAFPSDPSLASLGEGSVQGGLHFLGDHFGVWLTRGERFVGVELSDAGLGFGPVQRNLRRTSFSGKKALTWGALGFIKETTNGGLTWADAVLPVVPEQDELPRLTHSGGLPRFGCADVGCILGAGVRLGWGGAAGRVVKEDLKSLNSSPSGAGRYRLACSGPIAFSPDESLRKPSAENEAADGALEIHLSDAAVHLRVSGGPSGAFASEARTEVTFWDRFNSRGPERSLATRGLFESRFLAENSLGLLDPVSVYRSTYFLGDGSGGLIQIRTRDQGRAFGFSSRGPVEAIELPPEAQNRNLLGVARFFGSWLTAYRRGPELVLLRESLGRFQTLATLSLSGIEGYEIALVEGKAGRVGLFVNGDRGWFVYPLLESGQVEPPLFVSEPSSRPKTCGDDESEDGGQGFRLVREFQVTPHIESEGHPLDLGAIWARHRIGPSGVCLEGVSARARGALKLGRPSAEPSTHLPVPLVVLNTSGEPIGELSCQ